MSGEPRPLDTTPRPKRVPPRKHPRPDFGITRGRPVPTAEPSRR